MNILITGSNGFIGSSVVDRLKKNNNIIGCGTQSLPKSNVNDYVKWNLGHEDIPQTLLDKGIEAIIHIAANKSTDDAELELSYANVVGTHRILNLCKKKCKRIILISSIPIVQLSEHRPIREDALYAPPTMYHATKAAQELMFQQLRKYAIRSTILRIPSPIAPIMRERTIFSIFGDQALMNMPIIIHGRGTRRQNYIDTRDIAIVCEKILASDQAEGIYNIGSCKTISNVELAKKWIRITGSKSAIKYSGIPDLADGQDWMIDISRIKNELGYNQEYSIEQTMKEYMEVKNV